MRRRALILGGGAAALALLGLRAGLRTRNDRALGEPLPEFAQRLRPARPEDTLPPGAVPLSPRLTVVNFWATWCAPCREEMPALARAHAILSPEGIGVVLIASDRSPQERIDAFLAGVGADDLANVPDPDGALRAAAAATGLPTTLILGPDGAELARLPGAAEWDGPDALATLRALADTVS